ncbi:uncharacterized protein LOC114041141 [Vombatus ursinus]|uniref:uncharacterized protein LOC114041141 n=1 Tax=Vombatus ursinus TaxID=29139 RepID=UPI000FFD6446|nr:uncharacterized protein LOC114041141 [Vombatus ursinus]
MPYITEFNLLVLQMETRHPRSEVRRQTGSVGVGWQTKVGAFPRVRAAWAEAARASIGCPSLPWGSAESAAPGRDQINGEVDQRTKANGAVGSGNLEEEQEEIPGRPKREKTARIVLWTPERFPHPSVLQRKLGRPMCGPEPGSRGWRRSQGRNQRHRDRDREEELDAGPVRSYGSRGQSGPVRAPALRRSPGQGGPSHPTLDTTLLIRCRVSVPGSAGCKRASTSQGCCMDQTRYIL